MRHKPNSPERIERAIRQAHRLGPVWEPNCMPLRVPSCTPEAIRKRKSLEKK